MRFNILSAVCLLALVMQTGPSSADTAPGQSATPLTVENGALRDAYGRQVFLWGMNVGEKSSARRHQSWHGPEDFHNLRRWGMNAVRLLIFWSAIEPEPGVYDEDYLASVDERIGWARDAGLFVVLDMHQDLWSEAIPGGNGAPAWATLDDGLPHRTVGDVWSTAYFMSPKVHRAFDNFWRNAPGPDGVGLQDRFALAWQHVARRYAEAPEVIGFNFLNEPFPGSLIGEVAVNLLWALPDILGDVELPGEFPELLASITEHPLPPWLLEALDNPERQRHALKAIEPVMHVFERELLTPLYQRAHRAIREVHSSGLIFLEPCVLANPGAHSALEPLLTQDGQRDPLQVYMPHAYDVVVDTPWAHKPSRNRLSVIVGNKRLDADRLDMPLFLGEWGAYYGNARTGPAARMMNELIEQHTHGAFYWDYHRHIDQAVYFEVLAKPAPLNLAGTLLDYAFSPEAGTFVCRWESAPSPQPSVFAAPRAWSPGSPEIHIEPEGLSAKIMADERDPETRYVLVASPDVSATATLTLRAAPTP